MASLLSPEGIMSPTFRVSPKTLYLAVGIPASGKTTLRNKLLAKAQKQKLDLCVISQDEIRFKLLDFEHTKKDFDPAIEPDVGQIAMYELGKCVQQGRPIFYDATNVTKADRKKVIDKVKPDGYTIEAHYLPISPEYAIWRDARRGNESTGIEKRSVKPAVIYQKYLAIQEPDVNEGFSKIWKYPQSPTEEECEKIPFGSWKDGMCHITRPI